MQTCYALSSKINHLAASYLPNPRRSANVVRQPMAGKDRDDQVTLRVMSNISVIVLDPATGQRRAVGKGLLDDQHRLGAAFQL